ncbi:MAG: UbiA family prenyltransferase [Candidatus Dojkabacteria bacterium]
MIRKEFEILVRFLKNDIWATIIPGIVVTLTSFINSNLSVEKLLIPFLSSLIYFFFYEYTFVLSNQIGSIEEDKINKPFRPLPSNLVTIKGVRIRLILSSIFFVLIAVLFNVGIWAIAWVLITYFHNAVGHKHWITKNLISMSLGIFVLIGAGWEIIKPMDSKVILWAVISSFILGCCAVIQDFRDVKGDELFGRKTLPVDLGDKKARIIASFICLTSFISFTILANILIIKNIFGYFFLILIFIFYSVIVFRLLNYRDDKADHKTYMILLYLFNLILLSGLVYL